MSTEKPKIQHAGEHNKKLPGIIKPPRVGEAKVKVNKAAPAPSKTPSTVPPAPPK